MAIKVKLREKPISKGRKSLYLDFYPSIPHPETGKPTRREFLGMYIFQNPKTPIDKQHNKDTLRLGQQIRQMRDNELNKPEIYNAFEKEQLRKKELGERDFIKYFRELANKRKSSTHDTWISIMHYLTSFTEGSLKFCDLNEKFCNDFKEYLQTTNSRRSKKKKLSQNSQHSYFNKFKAALKQAYKDGLLQYDLNAKIKPIKAAETEREYLTIEELNRLVKTPCKNELLKRAALFSVMTGLRFCDIEKLVWGELECIQGLGYFIKFQQKKTKSREVLPISDQAYKLLGDPGEHAEKVFPGLKYSSYENKHLHSWICEAGIKKKISFHNFRHSYAVLQLANKTDIFTLSKLLGHRELKTTQIYAKVMDKAKREAADKIKLDL